MTNGGGIVGGEDGGLRKVHLFYVLNTFNI